MIDRTDLEIIQLLQANSRLQWREIGEQVHLTGQAVANRIRRLEELGIILGYTVRLDRSKLGQPLTAFITVFMKTTDHFAFHSFVNQSELVTAADRISGEGCYLLQVKVASHEALTELLNRILEFGNYRVSLSINHLK